MDDLCETGGHGIECGDQLGIGNRVHAVIKLDFIGNRNGVIGK